MCKLCTFRIIALQICTLWCAAHFISMRFKIVIYIQLLIYGTHLFCAAVVAAAANRIDFSISTINRYSNPIKRIRRCYRNQ